MYTTLKTLNKSFITDPDRWLGRSEYFDALFSGQWGDKQEDGSYFIETDSDIFEHILRYLRTGVLPVFYDNNSGHDFALYQAVHGDAEYFAIDRLCRWIRERKYLEAMQVHHVTALRSRSLDEVTGSEMNSTVLPVTVRQNIWYCHMGQDHPVSECNTTWKCSSNSERYKERGGWKQEDILMWSVESKAIIFRHDLCANAYLE